MERTLRTACGLGLGLTLVVALNIQVCGQQVPPSPSAAPLVLTGAIPLPNVKGRIDHFGLDPVHNRLFVSALGNNNGRIRKDDLVLNRPRAGEVLKALPTRED
jgi:hypothetical protein